MSLRRSSSLDSSPSHRSSPSDDRKRKLDDDHGADLLPKMKRREVTTESSSRLQIFVRMMISGGKTIVIHADKSDTVEKLHNRIEQKTKIPATVQRLVYGGKQLQLKQSLSYYSIKQDSSLHLLGCMPSTEHPVPWQIVDDIICTAWRMHIGEWCVSIDETLETFFEAIIMESSREGTDQYVNLFLNAYVPSALVTLFASPSRINKSCAKRSIQLFFDSCNDLPRRLQICFLPVVLEFFRLLRRFCPRDKLYVSCRNTLGSVLELVYSSDESRCSLLTVGYELFLCLREVARLMVKQLVDDDDTSGPGLRDVQKLSSFWQPLRYVIQSHADPLVPIALPLEDNNVLGKLYHVFVKLLNAMGKGMSRIESLARRGVTNIRAVAAKCSQYLAILKILSSISQLYQGGKERVARLLSCRMASFSAIIVIFAKREDDHQWIFKFKEATIFRSRRHLAMLLFPDVEEEYEEMHNMLIDRSNLLAESFKSIRDASSEELHGGLFMKFKNEEATGPGVLREWFYLVCQEIFNPQNALFTRSAHDFRRFSPNPASKVDPLHPDYYEFTGRVLALALMHKVQVGVLLDRVFFLRLAGKKVGLEDIKDTDPIMYNSCKQILEMDPVWFDSNAGLGLTFVSETEVLGERETKELVKDGKSIAVNSKNREQYVNLLIKHRFDTSISEQVQQFSQGFSDILADDESTLASTFFFKRLYIEDLDRILGRGDNLSIDDWKAHTEYNGFKASDCQIVWFWEILERMNEEERRNVLFFWMATKFIPVEGFTGLSSKLYIFRLHEDNDHLPTSHTCFYRLCLPKYPNIALMEQRLRFIAQDHVSSSFGKL